MAPEINLKRSGAFKKQTPGHCMVVYKGNLFAPFKNAYIHSRTVPFNTLTPK